MKRITDVNVGDVKIGKKDTILRSNGIGSCVVIVAYDPFKKIGGMAHVSVPGTSPPGYSSQKTNFAFNSIELLVGSMERSGVERKNIETCLVGGGNVLGRKDDTLCEENISSVIGILREKEILIRAKEVGGAERRTVSFDIQKSSVYFTLGDSKEQLLWKFSPHFIEGGGVE